MDIRVTADGNVFFLGRSYRCALGKGGVQRGKKEGDGATPAGTWPLRRVMVRGDKIAPPQTALPLSEIERKDGWCDDPADPAYNQPVSLPYRASAEHLWRGDDIYDVIVVLGYNDSPPVPAKGSAIFFHIAQDNYQPTEGCIAVSRSDMQEILKDCDSDTRMIIEP